MEKKSLGRGLEDISSTFMTQEEEVKHRETDPIFFSNPIREGSCLACLNMIEQPPNRLKCRIFSFKNEEYGVPALESIMASYAKYCRYFKPATSGEVDKAEKSSIEKFNTDDLQYDVEVEETVNRQKKIVFKDDGNVQNNFKKILTQHLEKGYEIIRIDLEKKEVHKDSTCRIKKHEEETIIKEAPF